jgi:hypothetical protein
VDDGEAATLVRDAEPPKRGDAELDLGVLVGQLNESNT